MRDLIGYRPAGAVLVGVAEENRGRILRANNAFASLLSSTPEALVGSRLCDHMHPADRARALAGFLRLIGGGRNALEGSCNLVTADGVTRPVTGYASLVAAGSKELVLARFLPLGALGQLDSLRRSGRHLRNCLDGTSALEQRALAAAGRRRDWSGG